jgi:hypothetical protein
MVLEWLVISCCAFLAGDSLIRPRPTQARTQTKPSLSFCPGLPGVEGARDRTASFFARGGHCKTAEAKSRAVILQKDFQKAD